MGFTGYYWLMIALLLLSIHTATSATTTGNTPRPASVNVGAIFPFNSTIGKVASIAIRVAVDDVNADPNVLRGTDIKLAMEDSERSGFLGVVEAIQFMQHDTVAIIGPQSSVIAHVVSHFSTELQVPMLSFASTDPTLSSLQYPFFIRTTQNDLFQMSAVADLINHYGWREVVAIYTDDDFGRNGIASLSDKLSEQRCRISSKAPMSPELNRDDITSVLLKVALTECRVMILHTYNAYGMEVLDVARHLEMLGTGFVWIATNWLTDVIDTYSPLPSEQMELIQGMITLRMYTPDSSPKRRFVSQWQRNLTVKDEGSRIEVLGLNTYGLYAYDSVWILARALDAYFSHGGNLTFSPNEKLRHLEKGGPLRLDALSIFDGGNDLLNDILDVNMSGLTGRVAFTPDRELIHPAYEIVNVIGTGHRRIGYWSNSSGLSTQPPEVLWLGNGTKPNPRLYGVVWPGQTTERPRGWVFPNSGKRLKVGVPYRISFKEFISYNTGTGEFNGYCIDVLMSALNVLPYAIPYELIPVGYGKKNPNINHLISDLAAGVYDAVVGDIAITTNRTKYADFTQPYIESGLVVVAPVRTMESSAWAFLRPFTPMMWAVTAISFLVVGIVMWILEHRINDDFRGPPKRQFVTVLWFSFSTLFFAHKEKTVSTLGRLVLIIWLFVVLIINSSYTASLTSILTVQQLSSPIKGIESLMANNEPIGIQQGSFARNYLTQQLNIRESRLVELGSVDSYAEALRKGPKNGGVGAVVDERAYIELFLSTRCDFTIVGDQFTKNGWGFAFPRDSPLAVDMTTALLKLSEDGDLQRIHDKWLMRSACRSLGSTLSVDRLELRSFLGLFLICGLSCLLALFAYLCNTIRQFMGYSPPEEEKEKEVSSPGSIGGGDSGSGGIMGSKSGRRLAKFLSFADEKEEVARSRSRKRQAERMCYQNSVAEGDASPSINSSSLRSTVDMVGSNKCVGVKCEA